MPQNHLNLMHSIVDALYFGMQLSDILLGAIFSCGVQRRLRGACHMVLISTASVDRTPLACLRESCICVPKGVKRYRRLDKGVRTLLADEEGMLRVCEAQVRNMANDVVKVRTLYLQSACAQMRQEVVLLKKVRRPATARLMSVLVGLRSRVVNRGTWTFRMSSGATLT